MFLYVLKSNHQKAKIWKFNNERLLKTGKIMIIEELPRNIELSKRE
jgi:hypothetical protein